MKQERETERREHRNNQQQPHQKCPRCDSYNTKFCYYNNYSLSQPRYYCKTCRRYWTQGGVTRNVPVGGGCRKGKRSKTSTSSGETSRSSQPPPPLPLQQPSPVVVQNNPYYQGGAGGLLSSLPAIQSLNKPINPLGGNYIKGPLNLALLKGYSSPNYGSQQHHHQQSQFFQIGNNGDENMDQDWHQQRRFINYSATTNTPTPSDGGLWNINSSSITATTSNTDVGSSLSSNQWHGNLPGYGPPQ